MAQKAKKGGSVAKKDVTPKGGSVAKKDVAPKVLSLVELQELAHAGTQDAVDLLRKYVETESDSEIRAVALLALEECEFLLYQPMNEKEEEDLLLRAMIDRREREIDDLTMEADSIRMRLEKLALEKKVHDKVLSKHVGKKKDWAPYWMSEFVGMSEEELKEIDDEIEYDVAWVTEAAKMLTTEKYRTMPSVFLKYFDLGLDDGYSDGDCDCDDCDGECDCDGDCGDECAPF
ncbi:MAG: hypothetical protein WCJ25_02810 [Candidatus Moraniibacteriota bacterium]